MRHLNGKGKGEHAYDYAHDILLFKIKNRDYKRSVDFGNIIVDVDTEGFITGLRVIDASKVFGMSKIALKNVKEFGFDTRVEDKVVHIQLRFSAVLRNKSVIQQRQDFVREALHADLRNGEVVCTVA
jgi:hypothetical protein